MKIGILGCGPAGLIAAATARHHGASVVIVSKKQKSFIAGAQYLHGAVPGVTDIHEHSWVEYVFSGDREGYAEKVYGDPKAPVSWDRYWGSSPVPAYSMTQIYDELWERFEHHIVDMDLLPFEVDGLLDGVSADKWISAVPLRALCRDATHQFQMQSVHIKQMNAPLWKNGMNNFVQYNGEKYPAWYRHSVLFGHEAFEWSGQRKKPPIEGVVTIQKPLSTTCDCHPHIARVGRYGAWNKNALVHHVAPAVTSVIERIAA